MNYMDDEIRRILSEHGRMAEDVTTLPDDADLYAAGLTSHACVNVMLALEDEFDLEFPDELLRKSTFASVTSIRGALAQLGVPATSAT
jgi:acyl carrier protein